MSRRTSRRSVTFRRPFSLAGMEGVQPPGTYPVETEEELLEQLSFAVWRRLATRIVLPLGGSASYQMITIDPTELDAAQQADADNAAAAS